MVATDKTTSQDDAEGKEFAKGAKDRTRHYYTKKVLLEERKLGAAQKKGIPTRRVNTVSTNVPQRKSENKGILLQTILPVIVTQKGTGKSVKTYTFYDNGSSGCFLTENLRNCLEATSTKTQLQLGTLHGQSVVDSAVVEELIMSDPNGTNPIELPRAYTTNKIPVQHEQIPTREVVGRIDHLKEIAGEIPLYDQELDIGLLIGNNCPTALVPLKEMVPSL